MTSGTTDWIVITPVIIATFLDFIVLHGYGHIKILSQRAAVIMMYIAVGLISLTVVLGGIYGYATRGATGFAGLIAFLLYIALDAGFLHWVKDTPQEEAFKQKMKGKEKLQKTRETPPPVTPQASGALPPTGALPPSPQPAPPVCPYCGGPLEYVMEYNRWYCRRCNRYV